VVLLILIIFSGIGVYMHTVYILSGIFPLFLGHVSFDRVFSDFRDPGRGSELLFKERRFDVQYRTLLQRSRQCCSNRILSFSLLEAAKEFDCSQRGVSVVGRELHRKTRSHLFETLQRRNYPHHRTLKYPSLGL